LVFFEPFLSSLNPLGSFIEGPIEVDAVGQHDDGLRAALTLVHRKSDGFVPVREQAAAQAVRVFDHPMAASILPNQEARRMPGASRFNVCRNHYFCLVSPSGEPSPQSTERCLNG